MTRRYVGAVVFDGVRVLLGKRSAARERFPGVWDIFGGHIERGETPMLALHREMREELGIEVLSARHAGHLAGVSDPDPIPFSMEVFLVFAWSGRLRRANREHEDIRWFYPDELDSIIGSIDSRLPQFVQKIVRSQQTIATHYARSSS